MIIRIHNPNGFPQVLRTWGGEGALQNLMGGGGLESIHGRSMGGGLKTVLKNTCEGIHL